MSPQTTADDVGKIANIEALLSPISKFKERSYQTSKTNHLPILRTILKNDMNQIHNTNPAAPTPDQSPKVSVVLLGDSMIERMTTTGLPVPVSVPEQIPASLPCLGDWPPSTIMSTSELRNILSKTDHPSQSRLPSVLNLGVGGDKIQNIAYRKIGEPITSVSSKTSNHIEGYLPFLMAMKSVQVWVIHAGTNNLSKKHTRGLADKDVENLEALVKRLLIIPSSSGEGRETKGRVLLTGLFPRTDIEWEKINLANQRLEEMVWKLNADSEIVKIVGRDKDGKVEIEIDRVVYMPPTEDIIIGDRDKYFVDHVHLGLDGYRAWLGELLPKVYEVLEGCS